MAIFDKAYAQSKFNVTPCANRRLNHAIDHIVVHYTGTSASGRNNCIYFGGGDRGASADFFIEKEGKIWKFNERMDLFYSWHCGDGHGAYGITNARSIGIELVSAGEEFTATQIKALKRLIRWIRKYYGHDIPVVRHYDASRKHCPAPYTGSPAKDKKWAALLDQIDETYTVKVATYAYGKRYASKRNRVRKLPKGTKVCIVSTWRGIKYMWGKLSDGNWVILDKTDWK